MYGKWLYKEIGTEYGACKVEIYRKNYTGESIEIGALAADSLSIALENLGSITDPIGKSVCSFSIIDTDQVEYDDFFTPDATALKVVVSTRVGSGAYVTRWSGYVTPDFFAENLSYRTPISISARDNIGYLNDVDFDLTATTITVREFIQSAFRRIAEDYPMSLSFVSQKQTAEGILAIDATISTTLLREMSWGEALETILHDLGLQMRWVDNNTIAVLDLSQIPEYYAIQGFNFIDASGYREIVPAWRELSQEQDFGLKENFFEGWLREDNITFVKSVVMRPPNATNWTTDIAYYVPNNWGVARDIYTTDPSYYGSKFGKKIFFTGVSEQNPTTTYFSWRQQIQSSIVPMKMSFKAFNSVLYPSEKYASLTTPSGRRLVAYNPKDAFHGQKVGEYLQIGLKANVLLHSGLKTYILKSEWVEISDDGAGWQLDFTLPKVELSYIEGNQATAVEPREEEITINIATIPYDGELEFRIYGWYIVGKHNYWEDDYSVTNYTFDWLKCLAYINEPTFSFNTDEADSGRETNVMIAEAHNIKQEESYIFGQTFSNGGGLNAYAGALVGTDGNELVGFQRNANATNYNLLELVGRELIHFNKRNYNRLSGTIKNLNKEPLMFNRLFVREGKKYAPYNYSLNVISNEMNITSMQEVVPYETATFNTIDSQITTGGGTVSGGNNTILQYSEEAGNEKRLYELQTATEQEKNDAYVLVDKAGFPEARKVHISELGGFDVSELEQYLESNGYATLKRIWEVDSANAVVRTTYNVVSTQEIISGRRASGASSDVTGGGGISQVTAQMIVNALGYVPYSSQNPSGYITSAALNGYAKTSDIPSLSGYATETWVTNKGYITSAALNGYATQAWVEGKKYLTAIPSEYITETELSNTLGSYQTKITSSNKLAYSLISGTPTLATVATSGKYSDLSGTPSSLPASDVSAWAKAATKPSYAFSEITGKPTTLGGYGITDAIGTSGGTLQADSADLLVINRLSSTNTAYITFKGNNSLRGRLGFNADGLPIVQVPSISSNNLFLIHSGNISSYNAGSADVVAKTYGNQSINFANNESKLRLIKWGGGANSVDNGYPGTYMSGLSVMTDYTGWQMVTYGSIGTPNPYFRSFGDDGRRSEWKQLAFLTDNVASATKLQTARTIWGKSFDGTGDVSGNLILGYNKIYLANGNDNYYLGWNGSSQLVFKNYYDIIFNTSGGNVLIGTTTNNTTGKLQVAGQVASYNSNADAGFRAIGSSYSLFFGIGNGNVNRGIYDDTNAKWWIFRDSTTNTYIPQGNVLIGTTTDNGGKLQVADGPVKVFMASSFDDAMFYGERTDLGYKIGIGIGASANRGIYDIRLGWCFKIDTTDNLSILGHTVTGGLSLADVTGTSATSNKLKFIRNTISDDYWDFGLYAQSTKGLTFFMSNKGVDTDIAYLTGNGDLVVTGEVISTRRATSSDARLKNNIIYLGANDCLELIRHIRPAEWNWKNDGKHSLGFIAQDVEQYIPYAVTRIKDDKLGEKLNLQYDQFIALAIGGVQAVDNEVQQLKKEVGELKRRLSKYETVWQ